MSISWRLVIGSAVAVVVLGVLVGPAEAQDSPPPTIVPTSIAPSPAAPSDSVSPDDDSDPVDEPETGPYPRTGSDLARGTIVALVLAVAGAVFAAVAHRRRNPFTRR